jgi:NAD-dependent DNA ligase
MRAEGGKLKSMFLGKRVVLTGKGLASRNALAQILDEAGAILQPAISPETDLLVSNGDKLTSKLQKAQKLGITIMSYEDVFDAG